MNLKRSKPLFAVLALSLTAAVLTGCGKSEEPKTGNQTKPEAAASQNEQAEAGRSAPENAKREMTEEERTAEANRCFSEGAKAYEQGKYDEALNAFKKASDLGDLTATYNIGVIYGSKKKDGPEALKWYLKAAEKGYVDAQVQAGIYYSAGEELAKGLKQDHKEAFKWFLKAAEKGDATAQYFVGHYYSSPDDGRAAGVEYDDEEAERWYRKAIAQGDEAAQKALDLLNQSRENARQAAYYGTPEFIESLFNQ